MPTCHDPFSSTLLSSLLVEECFFLNDTSSSRDLWLRMNWVSLEEISFISLYKSKVLPIKSLHFDDDIKFEVAGWAEQENWLPVLIVLADWGAHLIYKHKQPTVNVILHTNVANTRYSTNSTKLGSFRMNKGFLGNLS